MSEQFDNTEITTAEERDFSDAGITPGLVIFTITNAVCETKQNGEMAKLTLASVIPGVLPFATLVHTVWMSYFNPEKPENSETTQRIGRSQMKSIFNSVYGIPTGSVEGLRDRNITGWLKEDKTGRAVISSFQETTEEALDEALEVAGLTV